MATNGEDHHWFEPVADHLGGAYLRYSFTKGTKSEVDFLVAELGLEPGSRVLDVGCGPGRHALELADRDMVVTGVDISETFIELAQAVGHPNATFLRADAAQMTFDAEFDAVISMCQGAFGLTGGPGSAPIRGVEPVRPPICPVELDEPIVTGMVRALRRGGRLAVSAFSAYFWVRWADDHSEFDLADGIAHEHTEIRDPNGESRPAELWTTTYTPRELRMLARLAGASPLAVYGVTPGAYGDNLPTFDHHEFLMIAERPGAAGQQVW